MDITFWTWNTKYSKEKKNSILSHMRTIKSKNLNWTQIYRYKKKDDIQIWNEFLLIVIAQIRILTQMTTSNSKDKNVKIIFIALQSQ